MKETILKLILVFNKIVLFIIVKLVRIVLVAPKVTIILILIGLIYLRAFSLNF